MKKSNIYVALTAVLFTTFTSAQNLISTATWEEGTQIPFNVSALGNTGENSIVSVEGPHGSNVLAWQALSIDTNNSDGGFVYALIPVDHTKTYRITYWLKGEADGVGFTHLNLRSSSTLYDLNSQEVAFYNINPLRMSFRDRGRWLLVETYLYPSDYTGTTDQASIYDGTTGVKLPTNIPNDYKFSTETTSITLRYYANSWFEDNDTQFFYAPRIEEVNGEEPTIAELLAGDDDTTDGGGDNGGGPSVWTKEEGSNAIFYNVTDGNVGIGTATPTQKLDIVGNTQVDGDILTTGRISIGTLAEDPDYKLTVKGKVHVQEVKVDLQGAIAPDYVFYKDYPLKTLQEVQEYIEKEGHLPNIPSAKEMEKQGLYLKAMNFKLLEKVEELTLYTIAQQKAIEVQIQKSKALEERIQHIEALLKQ